MNYQVRFTTEARDDIKRLYAFLLEHHKNTSKNTTKNTPQHELIAITKAIEFLNTFPYTCRKAQLDNPFLRELIISFGANGYVALFEIEENAIVTILAIRHQREEDYL